MKAGISKVTSITLVLVTWTVSMVGFSEPGWCGQPSPAPTRAITQSTSPGWVPTGSLVNPRSAHAATLLPSGKVLVVGGYGGSSGARLDSAELYDPVTGTWSMTGHLSRPRADHTATLLADGRVLVAGGDTSAAPPDFGRTSTAELYDPATGTWTLTGSMGTTRSWHTATLLQDGKVLVAGGYNTDNIKTAELYDPVTGAWTPTGDLNIARYGHTATLLQDGTVLVVGGSNDGDLASTLNGAESYHPAIGTWSAVQSLPAPVILHTATLLKSGKVLIAGGYMPRFPDGYAAPVSLNAAQLYDPATGTWGLTEPLKVGRDSHTATLLRDGTVVVAGGVAWQGQYPEIQHQSLGSTETYDPVSGGWAPASSLITARSGHTATLLPDGRVLVAGGNGDGNDPLASVELYGDAAVQPSAIGPGHTGSWYDPAQSGHGLLIEVLSDNRFYAAWFTFNPAGTQQAWFTGAGTYSGNTATITEVEQPTGGRWIPNFDPSQVVRNAWGTLSFTFTDCNHGRVDFNSVAGYGTGSMNLTRLTQPAGLACP